MPFCKQLTNQRLVNWQEIGQLKFVTIQQPMVRRIRNMSYANRSVKG